MSDSLSNDSPKLAEIYDRLSDGQLEGGKRLAERLGLRPGDRVLDVGCGTGRLARWLAELVAPGGCVVGVDPLPERIAIARANAAGATITFEVGRAEDLGTLGDETFDGVCMSSVFHWIEDRRRALAEARRVLRAGGRIGVTTVASELLRAGTAAEVIAVVLAQQRYAGLVDLSRFPLSSRAMTTTDLISLVLESGLELAELHVVPRVRTFSNGEELVDFLDASAFGNFLRIVPDETRPSFRADLVAAFDARRGPGGCSLRDWGVAFVAAKRR